MWRGLLLAPDAPSVVTAAYRHLHEARTLVSRVFCGKEGVLMLRRIRDWSAHDIEASLRAAFPDSASTLSFDVLAHSLAGAQIALLQWWLEQPQPHTPEQLAQTFHRLQRAAIRDAFALDDDE